MVDLQYVFAIFFLTLGPLKLMPPFAVMTAHATGAERLDLAWRATLLATLTVLIVALVCSAISHQWGISWGSLAIAAGLFLLISSFRTVSTIFAAEAPIPPPAAAAPPPLRSLAFSPLAIPIIVTPYGVAAILLFMAGHPADLHFRLGVVAMLLVNMILNFIGMLFAQPFVKLLRPSGLHLLGWLFGILQAALAIEFMIAPIRRALLAQQGG